MREFYHLIRRSFALQKTRSATAYIYKIIFRDWENALH